MEIKVSRNGYIILAAFGLLILGIGLLNHYFFRTFGLDYASYNFAWYDYAHFRVSSCPLYYWDTNNLTFFQDHFSFTLILLAPLYWIFTPFFGTYSLIIIQNGFIILGGIYVYKLVKLKTSNTIFPNLALFLYFVTYGRFASLVADVNLEIILSSLIPVFLYQFEKKNFIKLGLVFLFLLVGRENFSLWLIFIGSFLLITNWNDYRKRLVSIIIIFISLLYFILAFRIFIPYFENPNKHFSLFNYSAIGDNPLEALKFLLYNPLKAISLLFVNHLNDTHYDFVKYEFYIIYLFSGGFLLLFRPKYLLLFIPIIAQKMYNDNPLRWSSEFYYSIEVVTILPIVVFLILNEIKLPNFIKKHSGKIKKYIGILIVLSAAGMTIHKFDFKHREMRNYGPDKNKFYDARMYSTSFDVGKVHNYLKIIPDDAKVSATGNITSHLAFRKKIFYFPRVEDAEYIVLLTNLVPYFLSEQEFNEHINKYFNNKDWEIIVNDDPLIILKKKEKMNFY